MTSDMAPLPGDDYMMRCLKLQHAAKAFNLAHRLLGEHCATSEVPVLLEARREASALLLACVEAMGVPVELGATEAGAG